MDGRRFVRATWGWLVFALLLFGCNFPTGAGSPTPNLAATAQALAATLGAQQPAATSAPPLATLPPPTPTPALPTLTPTASPTLGPPMLSVSVDTRCRQGPGKDFRQVGAVRVGEQVDALGRWDGYWLVRLGNGTVCWVWGQYATVTGDLALLSTVTPPPTPPPTGVIAGIVFSDHNFNGRYDPGSDPGKSQVTIFLHAATGGRCDATIKLGETQTDAQGKFSFTVEPATYCVWAQMGGMPVCHDHEVVTVRRGQTAQVFFYFVPCSPLDPNCRCP